MRGHLTPALNQSNQQNNNTLIDNNENRCVRVTEHLRVINHSYQQNNKTTTLVNSKTKNTGTRGHLAPVHL